MSETRPERERLLSEMSEAEREIFEKVRKHLSKYHQEPCPICGSKTWNVPSMAFVMSAKDATVPMLSLMCNECFFVRQFMWKPLMGSDP